MKRALILSLILGLILNGLTLLITEKNIVDLTQHWLAAVTQLILEIKPALVEEAVPAPPIVVGPAIVPIAPVEKLPPEEVPSPAEEIPPEKIVEVPKIPEKIEIPEVIEAREVIKAPEIPTVVSKEVLAEWPIGGAVDVVTGISGLVSWSVSVLASIVPAAPELPQTIDQTPTFRGISSIPFALIFLELSSDPITGQTQADENGYWTWTSPEPLSLGIHTLYITAQDPKDPRKKITSSQKFEVVTEDYAKRIEKTLFDVSLIIQAKYKKIYPGDDLLVLVEIIKYEPKGRIDIPLHYQIRDEKEEIILDHTEIMAIETRLSFLKTFHIREEAKIGKYKIYLEVPYNNTFVSSSDSFEIAKRPLFITPGVITLTGKEILGALGLIFGIFLIGLVIFVIFLYREFVRTREIRRITPAELRDRGLTRRGKEEKKELLKEVEKISNDKK